MFIALPFAELANRRPVEPERVLPVQTLALDTDVPPPPQWRPPQPQPRREEVAKPKVELEMPQPTPMPQAELDVVPELDTVRFEGDFALDFTVQPGPRTVAPVPAPARTGPWSLGAVDRAPTPRVRAEPVYPYRARQRGVEGFVELAFVVTETGRVREERVVGGAPQGVFEEAALQAVRRWRFDPARKDGEAVPVRVTIKLRFDLQ